jgi:hypothetical protein
MDIIIIIIILLIILAVYYFVSRPWEYGETFSSMGTQTRTNYGCKYNKNCSGGADAKYITHQAGPGCGFENNDIIFPIDSNTDLIIPIVNNQYLEIEQGTETEVYPEMEEYPEVEMYPEMESEMCPEMNIVPGTEYMPPTSSKSSEIYAPVSRIECGKCKLASK